MTFDIRCIQGPGTKYPFMDPKAFAYGNVNQRIGYLNLIETITHCNLDAMLQPEINRTFAVIAESLNWLADGMAEKRFGSSAMEMALLKVTEDLQAIANETLA
jgi:hypothetical protein